MSAFSTVILKFAKSLIVIYASLIVVLFVVQRVFVFTGPYVISMNDREGDYKEWENIQRIYEPEPGVQLYSWFLHRPGKPLIVFYGGNGRDVTDNIKSLSQLADYSVLTFNYRGFGKSTGSPTEENVVSDALMILDTTLKENKIPVSKVVVAGESLGSGIATQVAAARDVNKLVLLVPFDSLLAVAKERIPFVPVPLILKDTFRSDKFASEVKCPVSILAAENDEVIPVKHARRLSQLFPNLKFYKEYPGVGHNNMFGAKGSYQDYKEACRLEGEEKITPSGRSNSAKKQARKNKS